MSQAYQIATIFSAVDKFTAPIQKMEKTVMGFANRVEGSAHKAERALRRLTPSIGGLGQEIKNLAVAGGLISVALFSANQIKEYDQAIKDVQAITGVVGKAFEPFRQGIKDVAIETKASSVEVAKAFQLVGSANADLLKSPLALAEVTKQAVILSEAGGMAIEDSVNSLMKSMNQFGAGADKAQEFIDILATSQQKGTALISEISESMIKAGGTVKAFGGDFALANVYVQAFAKGGVTGSEAGTQIAGVLSKLAKSTRKEFNPSIVGAQKAIENLMDANLSFTELLKLTDSEGAKWITTLVNQKSVIKELTGNLNDNGSAMAQADIRMDSIQGRTQQLVGTFTTLITTTGSAGVGVGFLKKGIELLTSSLSVILAVVATYLATFLAVKTVMFATQAITWTVTAATTAYNVVLGISNAIQGKSLILSRANTVALYAQAAAQWVLNAALWANPIVWVVAGIIALIAVVALLIIYWEDLVKWFKESDSIFAKIARVTLAPLITAFKLLGAIFSWLVEKGSGLLDGLKPIFIQIASFAEMFIMPLIDGFTLLFDIIGSVGNLLGAGLDKMDIVARQEMQFDPINTRATQEQVRFESQKELAMSGNLNVNVGLEKGLTGSVDDSPSFVSPRVTRTR